MSYRALGGGGGGGGHHGGHHGGFHVPSGGHAYPVPYPVYNYDYPRYPIAVETCDCEHLLDQARAYGGYSSATLAAWQICMQQHYGLSVTFR